MKLISLSLAAVISGCTGYTVADLQADGNRTEVYHSEKSPIEFAACVIPVFDLTMKADPSHMRPTTTGVEVVKTGGVMGASVPFGVIKIDADGSGSAIQGTSADNIFGGASELRSVDTAIRGCL